ncbi:Protein O-mannosyltransferase 2 [Entophlyctis luteolus]|nr:Protein O-mannosyltransferase 2 [Entophlyctis luteolus]
MGSLFQYHLIGSTMTTGPVQIADGSEVQIRYHGAGGGFLHSHPFKIEGNSSGEQQVTTYVFREDHNNRLIIRSEKKGVGVFSGDVIRIGRILSGYDQAINFFQSTSQLGKCCEAQIFLRRFRKTSVKSHLGARAMTLQIRKTDSKWGLHSPLRTLTTRFRLQHVESGCYLRTDFLIHLPAWGFDQNEVSCTKDRITIFNSRNSLWNIDEHWNDRLPAGKRSDYPWSFYVAFMEDNSDKILGNSMLVRDPKQKKSSIESDPWEWPTMHAQLDIGGGSQMYAVLGMPIVWGGVSISLVVFCAFAVYHGLQVWQSSRYSGKREVNLKMLEDFWFIGKLGLFGWVVNFVPYILMPRVT